MLVFLVEIKPNSELETVVLVVTKIEAVVNQQEPVGSSSIAMENLLTCFVNIFVLCSEHEVIIWVFEPEPFEVSLRIRLSFILVARIELFLK